MYVGRADLAAMSGGREAEEGVEEEEEGKAEEEEVEAWRDERRAGGAAPSEPGTNDAGFDRVRVLARRGVVTGRRDEEEEAAVVWEGVGRRRFFGPPRRRRVEEEKEAVERSGLGSRPRLRSLASLRAMLAARASS